MVSFEEMMEFDRTKTFKKNEENAKSQYPVRDVKIETSLGESKGDPTTGGVGKSDCSIKKEKFNNNPKTIKGFHSKKTITFVTPQKTLNRSDNNKKITHAAKDSETDIIRKTLKHFKNIAQGNVKSDHKNKKHKQN